MILEILTFPATGLGVTGLNHSLQIGDTIYYSPISTVTGANINTVNSTDTIIEFGIVVEIYLNGSSAATNSFGVAIPANSIVVSYDDQFQLPSGALLTPPLVGDYIMFGKNKKVNSSGLKGYYAEVKLVNYSTEKVELFSIGSEVSESSK